MRKQFIERCGTRPAIGLAMLAVILAGGISGVSCGGSPEGEGKLASSATGVEKHPDPFEIRVFPGDGDVLRDLGRPIVVEFSKDVEPGAFSYRLTPASEDWSENWMPENRRVELEHSSPLVPDRSYELEVAVETFDSVTVVFSTEGPSTLELIARDEADGVIDLDTAWIHRLEFVFDYDALPEQYRSATVIYDVDSVLSEFLDIRSQLRTETLDRLRPYTVRPDHPDSVFSRFLQPTKNARLPAAPSGWVRAAFAEESKAGDGGGPPGRPASMVPEECSQDIVVWSGAEDRSLATMACDLIRHLSMYEKFEELVDRTPYEDTGHCGSFDDDSAALEECVDDVGGDRRLDIYIVPSGHVYPGVSSWSGLCVPEYEVAPRKATAYILVKPLTDIKAFASTIAHEIFHAFQYAFDYNEDSWWMEGTAVWAEVLIHPDWIDKKILKLVFDKGTHSQRQLSLKGGHHEYAVYLFPYYLEKILTGSERVIGDIWKACEKENSLDAIDSILDDGFDEALKEFSVVNLDLDSYEDRYRQQFGLFGFHDAKRWFLNVRDEREFRITDVFPPLSARYHIVYDGLDPRATPLVRFRLDDYAVNDRFMLHAIIKYDNGIVVEEDWSDLSERRFCINREEENFDQIYLIPVSAFRPPEKADGSSGSGPGGEASMANIVISVETEACRPTIGTGEFTIERETHDEDSDRSYTFVESVSGQVEFHDFHSGNAEYRGLARIRYDEHIENIEREARGGVVEWFKTRITDRKGAGDVECSLRYAWGDEDTSYNLDCGDIEIRGTTYERIEYPLRGEVKERNLEWTEMTDIDEAHISSHYGGLPERYDLEIGGHHLDEDTNPGRTTRDYSRWSFTLEPPS